MSTKCPPLQEILLKAWLGFVQQRYINKQHLLAHLRRCPDEYLEKTARIWGLSRAIVTVNGHDNIPAGTFSGEHAPGCFSSLYLGIILLGRLEKEFELIETLKDYRLPLSDSERQFDSRLEEHVAVCEDCQTKMAAIEKEACRLAQDFRRTPADCLKVFD